MSGPPIGYPDGSTVGTWDQTTDVSVTNEPVTVAGYTTDIFPCNNASSIGATFTVHTHILEFVIQFSLDAAGLVGSGSYTWVMDGAANNGDTFTGYFPSLGPYYQVFVTAISSSGAVDVTTWQSNRLTVPIIPAPGGLSIITGSYLLGSGAVQSLFPRCFMGQMAGRVTSNNQAGTLSFLSIATDATYHFIHSVNIPANGAAEFTLGVPLNGSQVRVTNTGTGNTTYGLNAWVVPQS